MEKIAVQFKNIGESKEGMRLYTQHIMQDKTFKSLESVIQRMYSENRDNFSEYFAQMS